MSMIERLPYLYQQVQSFLKWDSLPCLPVEILSQRATRQVYRHNVGMFKKHTIIQDGQNMGMTKHLLQAYFSQETLAFALRCQFREHQLDDDNSPGFFRQQYTVPFAARQFACHRISANLFANQLGRI